MTTKRINLDELEIRAREVLERAESGRKDTIRRDAADLAQAVLDLVQLARQRVTMPIGPEAGRPLNPGDALWGLSIEMLAHRSDLREYAIREADPDRRAGYEQRAADLERYATAVGVLALQLRPDQYHPDAFQGLVESAGEHGVRLPEWMQVAEKKDRG